MSSPDGTPKDLVADANVLIDYAESDRSVLTLISRNLAAVHIPSPVFKEVHKLTEKEAADLGIDIVEPTLAQAREASAWKGTTSFQDHLCFVLARDERWTVLTNDKALRKACAGANIKCMWGIEAMAVLVETSHLTATRAMRVAKGIARVNRSITEDLLERFRTKIGLQSP